jgi:type II restriction/modification system DNA methylase subunit YeeA
LSSTPRHFGGTTREVWVGAADEPNSTLCAVACARLVAHHGAVTPEQFIERWRDATLTERAAAQSHFNDLCELLQVEKPAAADPHGESYTFEKSVTKLDGRRGSADVWKRNCFAWEYKGDKKNLVRAYSQLKEYADALENPPLLIVSDMKEIRIHTNFTNAIAQAIVVKLPDLNDPTVCQNLRHAFTDPERLRPTATREVVTATAAGSLGAIARHLRRRQHDERRVAHFLNKLVFSMFVEDVGLLPERVFADVIEESLKRESDFVPMLTELFGAMRSDGRRFGALRIPWFDGGLFDDDDVLGLGFTEINWLAQTARLDWGAIEPSIFGTLFEQGLDLKRRKQMASLFDEADLLPEDGRPPDLFNFGSPGRAVGIHYTDPAKIMRIIEPVVIAPLWEEWESVKRELASLSGRARELRYQAFRDRLSRYRVLDPACGSGNFLYLALMHLKDLDLAIAREAVLLDLPPDGQRIGVEAVLGIEINPYAAELARVTVWIGELQWQLRHGFAVSRRPILGSLKGIVCRDALLAPDDSEAQWPVADVVIGNPPFLGGKRLRDSLGDSYVDKLSAVYAGRVPAEADLVCYWFEKARQYLELGTVHHAGLVATQSIRRGANRRVLERIADLGTIFEAWSDEPWIVEGAAVRVSLVCFSQGRHRPTRLNGNLVPRILPDLSSAATDLTKAIRLRENVGLIFMGTTKVGAFEIEGRLAREWLLAPLNVNERPNSDVVFRWVNGAAITDRYRDRWIIDFGATATEREAALYEAPFTYVVQHVKDERLKNRREAYRRFWWRHAEPRPAMRAALAPLKRYIATPRVAKYRLFVWLDRRTTPDSRVFVVARDDDIAFGILHSRLHEVWSLATGSRHGVGNDPTYNAASCFETFPFPAGMTLNVPAEMQAREPAAAAIANAARRLNDLRENWINPSDLVRSQPEVAAGYPPRLIPVGERAAKQLARRTLTKLYNDRPAWLADAHRELDAAVAAAYGWPADISDEDALARLFALNQERAGAVQG